jgi:peptidoglycan/LPS O-acetylase OafA/YrhL
MNLPFTQSAAIVPEPPFVVPFEGGCLVLNDKSPVIDKSHRLAPLDGLRGIAALIVVCFHFASAFLPSLVPDQTDHPFWVADTPIGILFNGPFAVSIFFVLSGFVVAQSAAKRRDPIYVNVALRYLRLALPATVSVIFAWCLLTLIPTATIQLNAVLPHPWLNSTYQQQIPNLVSALYHGLIGIFRVRESRFNNVLWTMKIEAVGSIAIYVLYGLARDLARPAIAVGLGFATLFKPEYLVKPEYLGFVLGALMRDLWSAGKLRTLTPLIALSVGILFGAPGRGFSERFGLPHMHDKLTLGASDGLIPPVAAALIVYAVLKSPSLNKVLSCRIAQYLGKVSFPLYLVHVPLLYTVFAVAYVVIRPTSNTVILCLFGVFLAISLILASAGEIWIDGPILNCISRVRTKLRQLREPARSPEYDAAERP